MERVGKSRNDRPAVLVDGLHFSYGHTQVLHGLSFAIGKGEVVGMLGPNGAGKSTTIKVLCGILPPGGGFVRVAGCSMPGESVSAKKRIGYVPESGALFESLSGQEFLELSGRLQGVPEETLQFRIEQLVENFGLATDRHDRLEGYSKGMRQKVLLSAALLHNPEIIMLDEPLAGLDVNAAIIVRDLIAALAGSGKTVIYSSHVLDVVERVCDRVLIIHKGHLIADGSLDSLKQATDRESLEDVFRQLTGDEGSTTQVSEIIACLET